MTEEASTGKLLSQARAAVRRREQQLAAATGGRYPDIAQLWHLRNAYVAERRYLRYLRGEDSSISPEERALLAAPVETQEKGDQ